MSAAGPILFTERLILRPLSAEDLEPWMAFHADPGVMRYLGGPQSRAVAWRGLCAMAGAWAISGFSLFAMIERGTGRWIGRTGPWAPEGWPGKEVGWGVLPEFAGKGFAYEAAVAAMDYAVDVLGWEDVIHTIDPDNAASIALARRLGSVNRGPCTLPPPVDDRTVDNWGQSADAWRTHRRQRGRG